MSAIAIKSGTLTIGTTSYAVREVSCGVPQKVDEIDCTTLNDTAKWYEPIAQVEHDVIEFRVSAATPPAVGSTGSLSVVLARADGGNVTVSVSGYVRSVDPSTIAVDGNRVVEWTVEFRPYPTTTTTGS